jgi:hypothetical protein
LHRPDPSPLVVLLDICAQVHDHLAGDVVTVPSDDEDCESALRESTSAWRPLTDEASSGTTSYNPKIRPRPARSLPSDRRVSAVRTAGFFGTVLTSWPHDTSVMTNAATSVDLIGHASVLWRTERRGRRYTADSGPQRRQLKRHSPVLSSGNLVLLNGC